MPENLLCPGQKIQTKEFRDHYDDIFSKRVDAFLGDVLMKKGKKTCMVSLEDVVSYEKKGWRRVK